MAPRTPKGPTAFRTISEVAEELGLEQHVLRFWETKFSQIRPMRRGGGRRFYRPEDVSLLRAIRKHLHSDGYTINGVQLLLKSGRLRAEPADGQAAGEGGLSSRANGAGATTPEARRQVQQELLRELRSLRDLLAKHVT